MKRLFSIFLIILTLIFSSQSFSSFSCQNIFSKFKFGYLVFGDFLKSVAQKNKDQISTEQLEKIEKHTYNWTYKEANQLLDFLKKEIGERGIFYMLTSRKGLTFLRYYKSSLIIFIQFLENEMLNKPQINNEFQLNKDEIEKVYSHVPNQDHQGTKKFLEFLINKLGTENTIFLVNSSIFFEKMKSVDYQAYKRRILFYEQHKLWKILNLIKNYIKNNNINQLSHLVKKGVVEEYLKEATIRQLLRDFNIINNAYKIFDYKKTYALSNSKNMRENILDRITDRENAFIALTKNWHPMRIILSHLSIEKLIKKIYLKELQIIQQQYNLFEK